MASFNKFQPFVADVANKVHNLGSDTLKILLTNSAPSAANAVKADITEISAGNGYSAGGVAVTGVTSTQTSGTYKLVSSADPVITASGAVGPFRYAVLYNSTAASGNLIGWWDYGSSISLANTDTFTIDLDQTNGILQIA
jgi:hypothetical protein